MNLINTASDLAVDFKGGVGWYQLEIIKDQRRVRGEGSFWRERADKESDFFQPARYSRAAGGRSTCPVSQVSPAGFIHGGDLPTAI